MAINFDKFAQEGNQFIRQLASKLGHPDEIGRTGIVLRAVLHSLRDSITVSESLNLLAQLPTALKVVYVDNWKYLESPVRMNKMKDLTDAVESQQRQLGEQEFSWNKTTEEIIHIVLSKIAEYLSDGQLEHIAAQMPEELKDFILVVRQD
jgi:uncharacterized protein (DUF2267 family)